MPYDINKCYKNFGLVLRTLRGKSGMTQYQLADICPMSRSSIADIECGRRSSIYFDELLVICNIFNITADEFLKMCESI